MSEDRRQNRPGDEPGGRRSGTETEGRNSETEDRNSGTEGRNSETEDRNSGTEGRNSESESRNQDVGGRATAGAGQQGGGRAEGAHSPPSPEGTAADDDGPGWTIYVYDLLSSALAVLLVGALLFAVSGVWPPLVAIESSSMSPHIQKGDLVFVMEEHRFAGQGAHDGVVTTHVGRETGYRSFHGYGDVIVYAPDGHENATPIIHRARLWVHAGENWYGEADPAYVGNADNCAELRNCPAPHAGFITKGDNNNRYDQVGASTISGPVRPSWVVGTAEVRVPILGRIRLESESVGAQAPTGNATANGAPNATTNTGLNATTG